jgi:hypothetical protein
MGGQNCNLYISIHHSCPENKKNSKKFATLDGVAVEMLL